MSYIFQPPNWIVLAKKLKIQDSLITQTKPLNWSKNIPIWLRVMIRVTVESGHTFIKQFDMMNKDNPLWPTDNATVILSMEHGVGSDITFSYTPNEPLTQPFFQSLSTKFTAINQQHTYSKKHKRWDTHSTEHSFNVSLFPFNTMNVMSDPASLNGKTLKITDAQIEILRLDWPTNNPATKNLKLNWALSHPTNPSASIELVSPSIMPLTPPDPAIIPLNPPLPGPGPGPSPPGPTPTPPLPPASMKWVGYALVGVGLGLFTWGMIKKNSSRGYRFMSVAGGVTTVAGGGVVAYELMNKNNTIDEKK